jgi:energy-coupling factor transporter ATP-binding protein EcfA2
MHRLTIHNFGAIHDATVDVTRFLLFIGPQASGKSTLSKLIYYFLHVRDEVTRFVIESAEGEESASLAHNLKKRLRNRFVEFFGPTPQQKDVRVEYQYTDECRLVVSLDQAHHKYVDAHFSDDAWRRVRALVRDAKQRLRGEGGRSTFPSAVGKLASERKRSLVLQYVREQCNDLFAYDKELFFIPAGRSLLSTLSDQLQYIHPHLLDYPMRQFVDTVNTSRAFFDRTLEDIVRDKQALTSSPVRFREVRKAQKYVRSILKGEYLYDREGGKLFVSPDVFTKINYASSGQQEAVWILLSLFLLVLENSRALVVIEEPEAHLYPDAQREIVEFVAFVFNVMKCDFVLTTHSPYVLAFVNNLLYAADLAKQTGRKKVADVISKDIWLERQSVAGYFVDEGTACPLAADDVPALKWELIDDASDKINEAFSKMLDLEAAGRAK